MSTNTIFLDTNIFMYAAGAQHPYKQPCLKILAEIETGIIAGAINTEVLQELLYRYARINIPEKGIQLCQAVLKYPLTILPVAEADIRVAVELFDAYRSFGLQPRDAIHAATMQTNGLDRLISADSDFDCVKSISRIDPLDYQ